MPENFATPAEFNFAPQTPNLNFYQTLLLLNMICQARPADYSVEKGSLTSGGNFPLSGQEYGFQLQLQEREHQRTSPQQKKLSSSSKANPSASPKTLPKFSTDHVFEGSRSMERSHILEVAGKKYHTKSTNGEIAWQNDYFLRKLGFNLKIPPVQRFVARTLVSGAEKQVIVYSLGQAREALPEHFQNILTSPSFLKQIKAKGIARSDENGILNEAQKQNKVAFAKMEMLGIGDISSEPHNIFYSAKDGFAFPDTDCVTNPTLPPIECLESMSVAEYSSLREFALSDQYQELAKQRLDLIKQNSSPQDLEIYNSFKSGFEKIKELFLQHETLDELMQYGKKNKKQLVEVLDVHFENPDLVRMKLVQGKVVPEFVEYDDIMPPPKGLTANQKHPFLSQMTTNPNDLKLEEGSEKSVKTR